MIELVMVIVLLGTLSVIVTVKWPSGMKERAAVLEFKRAVRHAQHYAMSREYTMPGVAWGIAVSGDAYTVERRGGAETAESDYVSRALPGNTTLIGGPVWFNGLGEPIDPTTGDPLATNVTFSIGSAGKITVCQETGYVKEGTSCP